MANELKRTYNIPLRREYLKVPRHKRGKKAVKAVKQFVKRHMKVDNLNNIKVGSFLNEEIWKHSIKNPPHHVKVNIVKNLKENVALVELFGKPIGFAKKAEEKKEGIAERVKGKLGEKLGVKPGKPKKEEKVSDKKTEEKPVEKTKEKSSEKKSEDDVLAELKGDVKEAKENKAEEAKKVEKEELKEMKKELPKQQQKAPATEVKEKPVEQQPNAPKKL